ncbi:MAG: 16S rRNA (guanine(527)-N(7))-methyltransferase RsmG, partial [Actinomycetales bacterium]|nr:16S rRNA (guanine(527)-N(7))-methyltransferase RsmG [Actinomycetales bacterium]
MKPNLLLEKFPDSANQLVGYANWLETQGVIRGLLGPREVDRIWDRHLSNCAAVAELIKPKSSIIDIGSGAGLPGLVLAIVRPDCEISLIEPLLRRSEFLQEVVADLGLTNAKVIRARAEQVHNHKADVVTARAVAPLHRLLGWALPLTRPSGEILAMKGSSAATEIAEAESQLSGLTAEIHQ